jgi:L-iditol 2-dehydrogenase
MLDSGGRFVLFAAAYPAVPLDVDPNMIHRKEIIISGSSSKDSEDLRIATKLLSLGMVNVRPLIERVVPFRQLREALDEAVRPDTYRVVVSMD